MPSKQKKRAKVKSTQERLRLSVFRSNQNFFAQIIDDSDGVTIASASSLKEGKGSNVEAAKAVGKVLAEKAKEKNVTKVLFDRGRYVYRGRVKAFAESARENGLEF